MLEEALVMEKMKLLEAKQAKDFADTDIAYREKRIASLLQSLKEEKVEKVTGIDVPAFIRNGRIPSAQSKDGNWSIQPSAVPSI